MSRLSPLEFNDCVIDGPQFRLALSEHEKEISNANKGVKAIYNSVKQVFDAMQVLSTSFRDLAQALREYPVLASSSLCVDDDSLETNDEAVIRNSLETYAQMIENIEDMRSELMMGPAKELVMRDMEVLKDKWFSGTKEDTRKFLKETANYCQRLEKYLTLKPKSSENTLKEADQSIQQDRRNFISCSMDHVLSIQQAQEKKKYKFVGTISLLVQMTSTFHHQAWEQFVDSKRKMDDINAATQRTRESYKAIHERTKTLKDKILATPPEKVRGSNSQVSREGYLMLLIKKPVANQWMKCFCSYQKDSRIFTRMYYLQTNHSKSNISLKRVKCSSSPESFRVKSCVKKPQDTFERRFCFDIEVEDKHSPITLQALSDEDLKQWLTVMGGAEPTITDNPLLRLEPGRTLLNANGFNFVRRCIDEIERRGLDEQGLYRLTGSKAKLDQFIKLGLDENGIGRMKLDSNDEYDTKVLSSAVKHYIRNLAEPLMTYSLHDKFISVAKQKNSEKRVNEVGELVKQLPPDNYNTLALLIQHLHKVVQRSEFNLMPAPNLGVVFGPTIFRPVEESVAAIMEIKFAGVVVEILIENSSRYFPRPPIAPVSSGSQNLSLSVSSHPNRVRTTHSFNEDSVNKTAGNGGIMERLRQSKSFRRMTQSGNDNKKSRTTQRHRELEPSQPKKKSSSGSTSGKTNSEIEMVVESNTAKNSKLNLDDSVELRSSAQASGSTSRNSLSRSPQFYTLPARTSMPRPQSVTSEKRGVAWAQDMVPRSSHNSPLSTRQELLQRKANSFIRPSSTSRGKRARTLYRCIGENENELSFECNRIIMNVRQSSELGWLIGELDGREGLFPTHYVEILT